MTQPEVANATPAAARSMPARGGLAGVVAAEAIGTGLLVMAIIGSGIAADHAFPDSPGLALLANAIATGATLTARTRDPLRVGVAVSGYITAAMWFTSSTAFANPAVALARIGTDTFTGINPFSAAVFLAAQALALPIAYLLARLIIRSTP